MRILLVDWYTFRPGTINAVVLGIRALKKKGHEVQEFPFLGTYNEVGSDTEKCADRFAKAVHDFQPHVALWWCWRHEAFLEAAHTRCPKLPFVAYNWDAWYASSPVHILKHYALIFSCCAETMRRFHPRVRFLLPAYDPSVHHPAHGDVEPECDLSFACTNMYTDPMFAVQWIPRKELVDELVKLEDITFHLHGPESFQKMYPEVYQPFVDYPDTNALFHKSRVVLSQHGHGTLPEYLNERTVLAMASGARIWIDPVPCSLLKNGLNCVFMASRSPKICAKQIQRMLHALPDTRTDAVETVKGLTYDDWAAAITKGLKEVVKT